LLIFVLSGFGFVKSAADAALFIGGPINFAKQILRKYPLASTQLYDYRGKLQPQWSGDHA